MRLLVITQKVDKNDPALGFAHRWLEEFAAQTVSLKVICLEKGNHNLPTTVEVLSLGKERRVGKIIYLINFFRHLWQLRAEYDTVFVHMNPEYLVLAGWWWRLSGKRILFWYTHRQVTWRLRVASAWSHQIFTAAHESFNLKTPKLKVVGHGIDTDLFSYAPKVVGSNKLVSVGRITPIKKLETLIKALALLNKKGADYRLELVGEISRPRDEEYKASLQRLSQELGVADKIVWRGGVSYEQMPHIYHDCFCSVNLAPTGGVDKAVLEAMACGAPAFVSNEAFRDYLEADASRLVFRQDDPADLADKIMSLRFAADYNELTLRLRKATEEKASLKKLVPKILASA